uniref:hypothetical protein n=1 Tax=Bacillus amyloliquefaciens TaxID=1390 RepID=UPI003A878047
YRLSQTQKNYKKEKKMITFPEQHFIYRKMYLMHDVFFSEFSLACKLSDGKEYISPVYVRMESDQDLQASELDSSSYSFDTSMESIEKEFEAYLLENPSATLSYTIDSGPEKKQGQEIVRLYSLVRARKVISEIDRWAMTLGYKSESISLTQNKLIYFESTVHAHLNLVIEFFQDGFKNHSKVYEITDVYLIPKK